MNQHLHPMFAGILNSFASNTPPGFEDPAFLEDLLHSDLDDTEDRYLIDELPHIEHLNTEPKEFEQKENYGTERK